MEKPTEVRAVIFDMDGVLVDSEPLINAAAIAMFKEKGLDVRPDDFLPFVGAGEDRYIGGVAERYGLALDILSAKARTYEIYLDLVTSQLAAFPGVSELIHICRGAGLLMAVASSSDEVKVRASLKKIGFPMDSWNAIITGNAVKNKKPAPDIFLAAAKKLGAEASECVIVEDAVNGIQAAHAAGMRCVAVAQTFPAAALHDADVIRERIADISLSDLAPHLATG